MAAVRDAADLLDGILLDDEQKSSMLSRKEQLKEEHTRYLRQHPELKQILNDFLADCLLRRPTDVIEHAATYFAGFKGAFTPPPPTYMNFRPLVVCGPSGVGKGTLVNMLMKEYADDFRFSVSHTTRQPREGEQDGVHYHFTDKERMQADIDAGKFIEHANVHGNLYGTSVAAVADVGRSGRICVLDIDVQGVLQMKKTDLKARYVFIRPPHPWQQTLEERLSGRGSETTESIKRRMETAAKEMKYVEQTDLWDAVIENKVLDQAYSQLKDLVEEDISLRRNYLKNEAAASELDEKQE